MSTSLDTQGFKTMDINLAHVAGAAKDTHNLDLSQVTSSQLRYNQWLMEAHRPFEKSFGF